MNAVLLLFRLYVSLLGFRGIWQEVDFFADFELGMEMEAEEGILDWVGG